MARQGGDVSDTPLRLFDFRSLRPLRSVRGSSLQPESLVLALCKCFKGLSFVRNQNLSWVREEYPLQQEKLKYVTDRCFSPAGWKYLSLVLGHLKR